MNKLTEYIINKNPENVLAIVIVNTLSLNTFSLTKIPIFIADYFDFFIIQKYDIEKETANYFVNIKCKKNLKYFSLEFPKNLS